MDKELLDEELIREIASVGGSYGKRLEIYMKELRRLQRAVLYLRTRIERSKGVPLFSMRLSIRLRKRFFSLKEEAKKQRFYLIVYREALGLLKHREVFELYNLEEIEL